MERDGFVVEFLGNTLAGGSGGWGDGSGAGTWGGWGFSGLGEGAGGTSD